VNVIGDALRNQDSKLSGQWQTLLGKAHEDRGHELLESLPARADRRVYREDGPDGGLKLLLGAGKCCDALLVEGTTWIAIDFVRHAFTARTVVDGTLEDLQRDLKRAIVQKVRQCDETLRRAVDHPDLMKTHGRPRRIYNLIVNGADMPLDPVLHKQIREAISNAQSSTFVDSPQGAVAARDRHRLVLRPHWHRNNRRPALQDLGRLARKPVLGLEPVQLLGRAPPDAVAQASRARAVVRTSG